MYDPQLRISAKLALNHKYFKGVQMIMPNIR